MKRGCCNAVWRCQKTDVWMDVQSVIICFVPVLQAEQVLRHTNTHTHTHTHTQLYFSDTWQLLQKCADIDALLKTTEQFCLMTILITRSTVNIQAQYGVSSGRELFCGNKQKRKGVNTWLALGDSKIDRKEGRKGKDISHTHKHKSTAVTSFQVNFQRQE